MSPVSLVNRECLKRRRVSPYLKTEMKFTDKLWYEFESAAFFFFFVAAVVVVDAQFLIKRGDWGVGWFLLASLVPGKTAAAVSPLADFSREVTLEGRVSFPEIQSSRKKVVLAWIGFLGRLARFWNSVSDLFRISGPLRFFRRLCVPVVEGGPRFGSRLRVRNFDFSF